MSADEPQDYIRHVHGPTPDDEGYLVGEIELPGGLPPEDDDQDDERDDRDRFADSAWDEAMGIAERDGFVVFDPDTTAGFRALTPAEQAELTDTVRVGNPRDTPVAVEDLDVLEGSPAGRAAQAEGFVERERPGVGDLEVDKALANSHLDERDHGDFDALAQRLDDLRVRLSGHTWREGVDRDEALADRREQLGRWHDNDHTDDQSSSTDDGGAEDGDGILPHCLIYPDDPRWGP